MFKIIISVLFSISLSVTATQIPQQSPPIIKLGELPLDTNGDKVFDIKDTELLMKMAVESEPANLSFDLNKDEKIDIGDVVLSRRANTSLDVNSDGKIDKKDTDEILKMSVGLIPVNLTFDLNKDGKIDIGDSVLHLRQIASIEGTLPKPEQVEKPSIIGDFNNDGKITRSDLNSLKDCIKNRKIENEVSKCDINGDGKINKKDLSTLKDRMELNRKLARHTQDCKEQLADLDKQKLKEYKDKLNKNKSSCISEGFPEKDMRFYSCAHVFPTSLFSFNDHHTSYFGLMLSPNNRNCNSNNYASGDDTKGFESQSYLTCNKVKPPESPRVLGSDLKAYNQCYKDINTSLKCLRSSIKKEDSEFKLNSCKKAHIALLTLERQNIERQKRVLNDILMFINEPELKISMPIMASENVEKRFIMQDGGTFTGSNDATGGTR